MPAPAKRPNATTLKLAVLIIATGAVSIEILASRAQRLRAAHAASLALEEARIFERSIDHARQNIAALSTPDRVRALIKRDQIQMAPLLYAAGPAE